jgi:glycosyltransferase involved in cell wall biosynthesis
VRCVAAILARNEADRFLRETVESLRPLCPTILVLDDHSEDQTAQLARDLGCEVRSRSGEPMWGQESPARQELWNWAAEECGDGWIYIADADHITHADPATWKMMLTAWNTNAWAMPLYDCWDTPTQHRVDGFWQGYTVARPWLFRPSKSSGFTWNTRGIHCGHAPIADWIVGAAPASVWINHYGWLRASDRIEKHLRYTKENANLSEFERAHVASILDAA